MRKYKLFGKIPIFDLLVIIVLLVVALVGYKVITSSKSGVAYTSSQTEEIIITLKFTSISEQVKAEPKEGELVVESSTNNAIGTVVSYTKEPFTAYDFNSDTGAVVATEYSDRYNLLLKVKAIANVSDIATEINGTKIGLGKSFTCSMPSLSSSGTIINIEEVNE